MNKYFLFFVFLCTANLFAQEFAVFTGLGGDKKWDNPANWSTNRVPGANDEAYIPSDKGGVELDYTCRVKKLTIEGGLKSHWSAGGSKIYTDQFIIKKTGDILLNNKLQILPNTNQLNIINEGNIHTDIYSEANRLVIGDNSSSNNITMNISGGKIQNTDFQFNGNVLDMSGAFVAGFINIRTNFLTMSNNSVISNYLGKTIQESSINIICNNSFALVNSSIECNLMPNAKIGGNINIYANKFINYGNLKPGIGYEQNGKVDIRAQHLFTHGNVGGGSFSASGNVLGKKSAFVEDNPFSNVIFSGDSVVIAMQDTSMIQADTLQVYGNHIVVAIQREAGIALYNGIEFYTPADGTVDFTQTTVNNAIAGGYSKQIHSNHILPTNQAQIQMMFFGNVSFFPADTNIINASATINSGYSYANTDGTLRLGLQNLSTATKSIQYKVSSKLGWVTSINDSTVALIPFAMDSVKIPYHIPPETIRGTEDIVQVQILINNVALDTIYSTITCLSRSSKLWELATIKITPTEVNMSVGEQRKFTAVGLTADADTLYYLKLFWSATGGVIDSTGLYTATQAGNFFVICADIASGKNANATVQVGAAAVETEEESVPTEFALYQNYPNPFNPTTTIKYSIPTSSLNSSSKADGLWVSLNVYDILGNEAMTLVKEYKSAGTYEVELNASFLSSGVYIYQLKAGTYVSNKKMLLMK